LSPGVNDSNTALVVIDHLSGALSRIMRKSLPPAWHCDSDGQVRVWTKSNSHEGILDASLHQIRQAAATQPAVIINLLGAIGRVGEHSSLPAQYEALVRHTQLVTASGLQDCSGAADRQDIGQACAATLRKLEQARRHASLAWHSAK